MAQQRSVADLEKQLKALQATIDKQTAPTEAQAAAKTAAKSTIANTISRRNCGTAEVGIKTTLRIGYVFTLYRISGELDRSRVSRAMQA